MPWRTADAAGWTTLRARLTLWNTAVVLLMTAATLGAVWIGGRGAIYREADATLRGTARETAIAIADLYPAVAAVVAELRRKEAANADRGWFTQLLADDGTTIWKSGRCPPVVAEFPPSAADRRENIVQVGGYRYVRLAIDGPDRQPFHIRIGMSTAMIDESMRALMRLLVPVAVALSLLTPLAGYWLAGRATRPVADILHVAARLRPTRLGDRLAVRGTRDELDRLSETINSLLDQVADHVERQERFVADAAHELRGPLTAVQSTLEVAVSQDRTVPEYRDTLVEVLEQARGLSKLANDLLLLAESGAGPAHHRTEPVDLARVAGQAVAMFAGVAEERGIELVFEPLVRPTVAGDADRLRQVASNLLDNALRFTPAGGRVVVRLAAGEQAGGMLTIADTGVGIAAADLDRIFARFSMIDTARSHAGRRRSGGLGLSICKSLVEACGGSIAVSSRPGEGTTVTVRLQAAADARVATPACSGFGETGLQ